jgi:hypothetical protein
VPNTFLFLLGLRDRVFPLKMKQRQLSESLRRRSSVWRCETEIFPVYIMLHSWKFHWLFQYVSVFIWCNSMRTNHICVCTYSPIRHAKQSGVWNVQNFMFYSLFLLALSCDTLTPELPINKAPSTISLNPYSGL